MIEKIKDYWNERANSLNDKTSTTNDIWLRELEIRNLSKILSEIELPQNGKILDVGCGDGYSTISIAEKFPDISFQGIDFSEKMIEIALSRLKKKENKHISFQVGSVLELDKIYDKDFDVVMTDRCLINLNTNELQKEALSQISRVIKNEGYYIGIENFLEGQNEMNKSRRKMQLSEIPVRWHNLYFKENQFKEIIKEDFNLIELRNFSSSYYFATRVIYSKMCQMKGESPNYNHEIHQLATELPNFGNFSPIKCFILQKRGKSS